MDKDIMVFIVGQAIGLLGIGIGAYLKIMTRLKEFEIRIDHVEKQDDAILKKLDEIQQSISDLRVDVSNKKNRDN